MKSTFLSLGLLLILTLSVYAQPGQRGGGGGERGQRPDPAEQLNREKLALYKKVSDLSEDQKMLLDGIYEEFGTTVKEKFEEARESGSREGMREKMQELRKEKDLLIKDVLSENQFGLYEELLKTNRENRQGNRPREEGQPD